MGFMDKMKDMAGQAGDYTKDVGSMASAGMDPGMAAESARLNKLGGAGGVETPALLKSVTPQGEANKLSGGIPCVFEVEVRPAGGAPYEATFSQELIQQSLDGYLPYVGKEINVKVDPDDPQAMIAWTIPGA